ncbi:MAG: dephospho-CoA kinase [Phycisphaerales bacterium]|nr:MAG: dephospho-CoA kinase [Phycisphaerales bacterium]
MEMRARDVGVGGGGGRPLVIGLAGGVGSGKSAVARAFESLGCVVIDSDAEVRVALERPDVRAELARWWGPAVLAPDGSVNRKAVASIVFTNEAERKRLEGLIHPLLRRNRAQVIEAASGRGGDVPAVILDAPLLFEAGLVGECDAVVFVDSPREMRVERVRSSRGWEASELDRREKSQAPLEEKRRLADYVIQNDADESALRARTAAVFERIMSGR